MGRRAVAAVLSVVVMTLGVAWFSLGSTDADVLANPTDDPVLIAAGRAMLDALPDPAGGQRDPYGSACSALGADFCASSPSLGPADLLDAVGSRLTDAGARVKRRTCADDYPIAKCYAVYAYRGVHISLLADDVALGGVGDRVPAFVGGMLLTTTHRADETVPLGPWSSLGITPAGWVEPVCTVPGEGGCLRYQGGLSGTGTREEVLSTLRETLRSNGYLIEVDRCSEENLKCRIVASRNRELRSRAGMLVQASVRAGERPGTHDGSIHASALGSSPSMPASTPQPSR